jgi:hypothetical protein
VRRLLVYLGTYFLVAGAFFGLFWLIESTQRDLGALLSKNGVVTTATVTRSEPQDHNTICFTYSVDGVPYSGCDSASFGKVASELPPGSSTFVTYDRTNPLVYCACPAELLVRNAREAPVVGALVMGTFLWASMTVGVLKRKWTIPRLLRRR